MKDKKIKYIIIGWGEGECFYWVGKSTGEFVVSKIEDISDYPHTGNINIEFHVFDEKGNVRVRIINQSVTIGYEEKK